jgi:hypothetical protein
MQNFKVVTGAFTDEGLLFDAIHQAKHQQVEIVDVQSPYPLHGLDEALELPIPRLARVGLVAGIVAFALGLGMQVLIAGKLYPINFGGKPFVAIPSFMPVVLMFVFIMSAFAVAIAFMMKSRLGAGAVENLADLRVTDDRFVLIVAAHDEASSVEMLKNAGADEVRVLNINPIH